MACLESFVNLFSTLNWTAIGSIATFSIALLTYSMICEMRLTRERSIAPQIILLPPMNRYHLYWIPKRDPQVIITPELNQTELSALSTRMPMLWIKNLGSGVGTNLCFYWEIDEEPLQNIFESAPTLSEYRREIKDCMYSLTVDYGGTQKTSGLYAEDSANTEMPYCIASPSGDHMESLDIPHQVIGSYCLRLIAGIRVDSSGMYSGPAIHVTITYKDLTGKSHNGKFSIQSSIYAISDQVGCSDIPITQEYFDKNNIRCYIRFSVSPI